MSFPIPKIQYKNVDDVNGFTTSTTRIVLDDITGAEPGMLFTGPGVPEGTFIDNIETANNAFNLTQEITPTLADLFSWCFELKFRYPPESNDNFEKSKVDQTVSTSRSGVRQYLTRYIERERKLGLNFLNLDEINFLKRMFDESFSFGEFVRWFDDQLTNDFVEYQANDTDFDPAFIQGTSELYALDLDFVRAGL